VSIDGRWYFKVDYNLANIWRSASLSACIRLKYTVNLTNATEYMYGLANIVLWGYAENGIGLFVGNLATLRPLFRTVLGLGTSSENTAPMATANGLPSKTSHPYRSFDAGYEMGTVAAANGKNGSVSTQTQIMGGDRSSLSSDNDSQKDIVEKSDGNYQTTYQSSGGFGGKGIVVSRQVDIQRH
jgi:hypothetical protein